MTAATRELSISYGGVTFGGSSARQITGWTLHEEDYDSGWFEFEIVTTAATEAAFASEVAAVREAFRKPRQDLVVTLGSSTILSRKHSDNTALDTMPRVVKDGDPADTARSRHFRLRVDYGLPADNVSTNFRRWSQVNVEYAPTKLRTVTITGEYTANSTDGSTGAFAQYRAQISSYISTVTAAIDSSATWELVGEPQVERNETNKVCRFTVMVKEVAHRQSLSALDDADIVDPQMTVFRERISPGDSVAGGFTFGGGGIGAVFSAGPLGNTSGGARPTGVMEPIGGGGGASGVSETVERPTRIKITYTCAIDATRTKDLRGVWENKIRPYLISEARNLAQTGIVIETEDPGIDQVNNRINASMECISYRSPVIEQRITVRDTTQFGRRLRPVTTPNPYDYYEYPGPAVRQRSVSIELQKIVTSPKPESELDSLVVELSNQVVGITDAQKWVPLSNDPAVAVLKKGLVGASNVYVADIRIERVAQRRNKKSASVANAGGVTGSNLTV